MPLTPSMRYALVRAGGQGFFLPNLVVIGHVFWPLLWWGRFKNMIKNLVGPSPIATCTPCQLPAWYTRKHEETRDSRAYAPHMYIHTPLPNICDPTDLVISVVLQLCLGLDVLVYVLLLHTLRLSLKAIMIALCGFGVQERLELNF